MHERKERAMLDLHKLQIFMVVAQEGSFSAAADRLYVTQSAVSQHIKELEASLGRQLFQRGRRGVALTPQGDILLGYAREIFALVAQAERALTDVQQLRSGRVSIGATPGIGIYLAPDWVQRFRARYPQLTVALETGVTAQIVAGVLAQRLELGFIEGELDTAPPQGLAVCVLREVEQMVIVGANHAWRGRTSVPLEALSEQTFIMRPPNSQSRLWLNKTLHGYGIDAKLGAEFDNLESIKRAVASGTCITVLPAYVVQQEVTLGQLYAIPVQGAPLQRSLKLICGQDSYLSPVARAFLTELSSTYPAVTAALNAVPVR